MPNSDIDKRDILLSVSKNGEIVLNVGEVVDGVGVGSDIGMWGTAYHVAMPDVPDPTTGKAAQALVLVDGQGKRVIATRDNRAVEKLGEFLPGDAATLSGGPGRMLIKKEGGVVSLYSELEDGSSLSFTLDPANSQILQSLGKSYIEMKPDSITLSCGPNMLRLDSGGVTVIGTAFQSAAGMTLLGTFAIPPLPTDAALKGATGPGGLPSTKVFIAT